MVAREAQESPACEETGDRSGQRPGDVESADAVRQAVGGVRGPVRSGDRVGVLSSVSQQVQSDRAMLGDLGDALERGVVGECGDSVGLGVDDDMEGATTGSAIGREGVGAWEACGQEGDEAVRGPSATLRDSSQVECGNHSSSMLVGNLSLSDCLSSISSCGMRSDKPPPCPRENARPCPNARDASRARDASAFAPCRPPTNGPLHRSKSDCPIWSVPVAASCCRSIGSISPPSPTYPRSPSLACSPIASGSIAARLVTRPCAPPIRTWLPISSGPPPTGWDCGSWPRLMRPTTAWVSPCVRCPPSCASTPECD